MAKDERNDVQSLEKRTLLNINNLEHELDQIKQARTEPIAVIGIGCRFPGGANSPEEFWQMLAEGRDAVQEMPIERYDIDEFYHPDINMPGKTVSRWGAFLEHIDQFDPGFFGISPREAIFMDPQQRILLEVTWEALERAGVQPEKLMGSSTGVFIGLFNKDYSDCITDQGMADRGATANSYLCSLAPNFGSGRISYHLGLQGPCMTVDTACSSSLVAVHLACQSLRNDECRMALAGAVDLRFHPWEALVHSKMRGLSPRGRCRTFDASADGFVHGEGCGVVVLKRYSQALAEGDPILALIRGSALASDGRSNGLIAPNGKAQEVVLRQALHNSGVAPEKISFIEAHGTGTRLGDPVEFEALNNVIGLAHPEGSVCMLGSVKTNIGHLEAAAGMAGLVKTILCLQHRAIPPHLHLEKLNPLINLDHTPFLIPKHLYPWLSAGPRYAGVSASGLSGTNAHIVLEEASESIRTHEQPLSSQPRVGETWLLPLSAKNVDGLRQLAQVWYTELQSPNILGNVSLRHICSTASLRRTHYQHRLALVGDSHGDLTTELAAFLREGVAPGMRKGEARLENARAVFVFSGQGAQWAGMGQELFKREAVFRTSLEKCDALLLKYVSWSLLAELKADENQSRLHETAIAQPALFSLQVALSELWRSWGIQPVAVVGHSVGEIAAAYVAGVLDLEDAIRVVVQRGTLMQQTHGLGYMAAVEISGKHAREFLIDYTGRVAIAAVNSASSVVLSGETVAMHEVLQKMLRANVPARELNVENAFHSPQMKPLRNHVVESLQGIKPKPSKLLLLSTVTGEPSSGEEYNAAYWGRNMCETVCFGPAIEKILDMGFDTFLEISPHPVLARSVMQSLTDSGRSSGIVVSSMRRGVSEGKTMLTALGTLYTHGFPVKWEQIYLASSLEPNKVVPLPTYPWQRQRYWFSENFKPFSHHATVAPSGRLTGHPLLGRRLRSATRDIIFETTISIKAYPWLVDHKAFGMSVFPASAYMEMMHESVRIALKYDDVQLTDIFIPQALTLSPDQEIVVQVVLQSSSNNLAGEIQICSCSDSDKDADVWTLHASSHYQPDRQGASIIPRVAERTDLDTVRQRCTESTQGVEHCQRMSGTGLELGPAFQGLQQIWWRRGEALGKICLPQQLSTERRSYFMHPVLLDACIQTVAATVWTRDDGRSDLYLPLSMERLFFHQQPGNEIWVHTTVSMVDLKKGLITVEVRILSESGETIALIDGLHVRRASPSAVAGGTRLSPPHWLYKLQWNQTAHQSILHQGNHFSAASPRSWLFFCDNKGNGKRLAAHLHEKGEQCLLIFADHQYQKINDSELQYTVDPSTPEHFQTLLQECTPLLKYHSCGIVYLWAVDAMVTPEGTSERLMQEQQRLCGGLLHLVQAVVGRHWATSPQLWVITQNCQDVKTLVSTANASAVVQAQLWGLGRAIAYEHPDLQCRLIDFPDHNSWEIERLIEELLDPESEEQIALRMEGRYIARLAVAESDVTFLRKQKQQKQNGQTIQDHAVLQFGETGTYLITGGLGGLGIAIGQWMVEERRVRHLVLTGRQAPTPEVLSIIKRLEQRGAQILLVQTDVTDQTQVAQLLKTIQQAGLQLRGIIHSAGVLDDGVIVQLNWDRFARVLAPKVQGTWNLHMLTRHIPLDFFVLFSSLASLLAVPGQANYAAANAFMDGMAHYRRSMGLPAISINWGPWADVGMTKDSPSFERRLAQEGVQLISLEQGMAAFEQVLLDNPIQMAVFPIDTSIFKGIRAGRQVPIVLNIVGEHPSQSKEARTSAAKLQAFKQPYAVRFQERPEILLEDVSRQAMKVLGLDPTAHFERQWNLFESGLDSFTAIELRDALHKETGLSVPANLVFNHPTVAAIAAYLAKQLPPLNE